MSFDWKLKAMQQIGFFFDLFDFRFNYFNPFKQIFYVRFVHFLFIPPKFDEKWLHFKLLSIVSLLAKP